MNSFWTTIFDFTQTTADRIGSQLLQDFGSVSSTEKQDGSLVTPSDQWADTQLQTAIAAAFPDHGYLSEESEHVFPAGEWCWIVDPIDGTTNFAHGIPIWGISIALLYRGTPVFGYFHLPPLQQTFHGFWTEASPLTDAPPAGAFLNQQPIQPSPADPGPNQLFNFCSRSTSLITPGFPCKVRMLGGAGYNMLSVATGTFLGAVEQSPKIWDIAAVWVIVKAAGAVWISLDDLQLFPLTPGQDYGRQAYRTLLLSRKALLPEFLPRIR
jgi:myo-inositol-1(or 4)-monophosphatase